MYLQYCKKTVPNKLPRETPADFLGSIDDTMTTVSTYDASMDNASATTTQDEAEFGVKAIRVSKGKGKRSRTARKARKPQISDMDSTAGDSESNVTPVGSVKSES